VVEPDATQQSQTPSVSPVGALFKVLIEPREAFDGLREKSPWVLPAIILFAVILAFTYSTWPYLIMAQAESIRLNENIPAEQRDEIIENMRELQESPSPGRLFMGPAFASVSWLIATGIWLMVGNVILGGDGRYKQYLTMFLYASMTGIPEMIVKGALIHMKGSAHVYTSLALLTPSLDTQTFLFRALDQVDVFSIWFYALVGIGLSVLCGVRAQKAMIWSFVVWAVWAIGIKAGLGSLFGGMFGM